MTPILLSHHILDEMVRILPHLSRVKLSATEIRDLADSFMFLADVIEPVDEPDPDLRDPCDQLVLATLKTGQARYLITGDKDLLALADRYPIVSPAEFWAKHGA